MSNRRHWSEIDRAYHDYLRELDASRDAVQELTDELHHVDKTAIALTRVAVNAALSGYHDRLNELFNAPKEGGGRLVEPGGRTAKEGGLNV